MTPKVPVGLANSQFYLRGKQNWAIEQENYRHDQAMYSSGEYAMFVLMWKVEDHRYGYVRRCPRCYDNGFDTLARASAAYQQPTINKCPMCYGTTFEGGVRAKVIRPALFTDTDDQEQVGRHGVNYPQNVMVESTSDFRYRAGDYVFRADGSRYQLSNPQRVTIRTGFGHVNQIEDTMGYAPTSGALEDPTSVAWIIPPDVNDLRAQLATVGNYPISRLDILNGPLIPDAGTD